MAQKLLQWVLSETDEQPPQQKESEKQNGDVSKVLLNPEAPKMREKPSNNAATIGFLCVLEFRKCMVSMITSYSFAAVFNLH